MKYILDAGIMRAVDQYAMNEIGIPSMVLMEKAAMKLAEFMLRRIHKQDKILAVCGTGNNGGDGVACARILSEQGFDAEILFVGDENKATVQMKQQLNIAKNLGMSIYNSAKISEYNVIIDGLFGVGLSRPIEGIYEKIIQEINDSGAIIYAVDLPSGISGTNGNILNIAIKAHYTVTFGYYKLGLLLYPGCEYAGEVEVTDIGFPKQVFEHLSPVAYCYEEEDLENIPVRKDRSNKGTFGRVLVIAGSENVSGAAYLSAKAAYRAGAGLVKIATPECNREILQTLLPEALLSTYQTNNLDCQWLRKELQWATVVVLGPGIGTMGISREIVSYVMENVKNPLILDADAINVLADDEKYVINDEINHSTVLHLPSNVILTPHLKELSRLTKLSLEHIVSDVFGTARRYHNGFVLVLKDARTVVMDNTHAYVNMSGNNGMATGGSGDVLTGIIAGLIAQGMDNFDAAAMAVYVHGLAGDYAAEQKNCYSIMASDILEALSSVLQTGCRTE